MAIHPIGLTKVAGRTAVGTDYPILLRGEVIEMGGGPKMRVSFPIEYNIVATGAAASTATALVEQSWKDQTATNTTAGVGNGTSVAVVAPGGKVTASITTYVAGDTAKLYYSLDGTTAFTLVPDANLAGNSTGFTAVMAEAVVSVPGALAYRWQITASSGAGGTVVVLTDWVLDGSALSFTIPADGSPKQASDAPLVSRLHSFYDLIRLRVTAVSGCTVFGWVKRRA